MKTLKENRKELKNEYIKNESDRILFGNIFFDLEKQDKEFIKEILKKIEVFGAQKKSLMDFYIYLKKELGNLK